MKTKTNLISAVAILASGYISTEAGAAVSVTNFVITGNSVSFDISGTFPAEVPEEAENALVIANSNQSISPGFTLVDMTFANSGSFSGTQILRANGIGVGPSDVGDYFYVVFQNNFSAGESISGTVSAAWNSTVFDPPAASSLNIFWGTAISGEAINLNGGTLLATIPEPSAACLLLGASAFTFLRRRRA